jgi:hypothetical protein
LPYFLVANPPAFVISDGELGRNGHLAATNLPQSRLAFVLVRQAPGFAIPIVHNKISARL